jgi:hypothetical protein
MTSLRQGLGDTMGQARTGQVRGSALAGGLAHIWHEGVHHVRGFQRYAGSGWWAGVPQQGAGRK